MIAGFFFSGKLIAAGELEVNNFFLFSCNDVGLSTNKIFATINMTAYQGATALKNFKYY